MKRALLREAAEKAGLTDGDVITGVNDIMADGKNSDDMLELIIGGSEGNELVFTVDRGGETLKIDITYKKIVYQLNLIFTIKGDNFVNFS